MQFLRDVLTAHSDFTLVLPGSGEVISKLHSQPRFRCAAECLGEPDSHLRADAGLASDDVVESLSGDAENLCAFGNGQPQGFKASRSYAAARMGWIFHGHGYFSFSLVIVDQFNVKGVFPFKTENDAPVGPHRHGPEMPQSAFERMQPVAVLNGTSQNYYWPPMNTDEHRSREARELICVVISRTLH
jgi:hypothetical protein